MTVKDVPRKEKERSDEVLDQARKLFEKAEADALVGQRSACQEKHSHKKRKDSLETWAAFT